MNASRTHISDWVHYDLRCYTCDSDLLLADGTEYYCSEACQRSLPLTAELVQTFRMVLHHIGVPAYLDLIGSLAVADAMLEAHPYRGAGRGRKVPSTAEPDALRSTQWRRIRIEQLESLITL